MDTSEFKAVEVAGVPLQSVISPRLNNTETASTS